MLGDCWSSDENLEFMLSSQSYEHDYMKGANFPNLSVIRPLQSPLISLNPALTDAVYSSCVVLVVVLIWTIFAQVQNRTHAKLPIGARANDHMRKPPPASSCSSLWPLMS